MISSCSEASANVLLAVLLIREIVRNSWAKAPEVKRFSSYRSLQVGWGMKGDTKRNMKNN